MGYLEMESLKEDIMPMKSQAQRKYLHANKPTVAKKLEAKTPIGSKLPRQVKRK